MILSVFDPSIVNLSCIYHMDYSTENLNVVSGFRTSWWRPGVRYNVFVNQVYAL